MDRYTVSNEEYEQFDPAHRRCREEGADKDGDPVVFVTYLDCMNYCRWRSQREGLPSDIYLLPSEAQWEFVARKGNDEKLYPWGDEINPEICNTLECQRGHPLPVRDGKPNGLGLMYIGSNVREWCCDLYLSAYYTMGESRGRNPAGPKGPFPVRMHVVRGASFQDNAEELGRCTARNFAHVNSSSNDTGFRCVRLMQK
jgi:formylglycine-generating enzyme required for sulfatase activity